MPWTAWAGPPPPTWGRCWRAELADWGPEPWTHWLVIAARTTGSRYLQGDPPAALAMSDVPMGPPPPPEPRRPVETKTSPTDEEMEAILASARRTPFDYSETPWNGLGGLKRLAIFVVGLAAFFFMISLANPRYEHRVVTLNDAPIADQLNQLGNGGWEVVSIRKANEGNPGAMPTRHEVILKRKRML